LNAKIEKKSQLKNKLKKKLELIELNRQTRDMSHETKITIKKQTTINYEILSPINQVLKDEIKIKVYIKKKLFKQNF